MNHLDFVDKIGELGISIRSTKLENRQKRIEIHGLFNTTNEIIIDGFELSYVDKLKSGNPLKDLIVLAIDMGQWKHSWHYEIVPENYDKFQDIIQSKILDKAKEIETLLTVYFQINYEKSTNLT